MGYFSSITKKGKRLRRMIKNLGVIARLAGRIHSPVSLKYPRTFCHFLSLCLREEYKPQEAFGLGLFNPELPIEHYKKFISKQKLFSLQRLLNPACWDYLTENKSIFYNFCKASDVPIPEIYGIFFRKTPGWGFGNKLLSTRKEWTIFFEKEIPDEFVIKPAWGVYGKKITILKRTDKGFLNRATGKFLDSEGLYELMMQDSGFDQFVIQERLRSHPEIVRFTDNPYLQTVRITTYINGKDECLILHGIFKMILGDNVVDNFSSGATGNIITSVELNQGTLRSGKMAGDIPGMLKNVSIHPKTGDSIEGFQIPLWRESCALVKECAFKFLPIRTIGWDVGITERGPLIVEGNMWWDPPNIHGYGRKFFNIARKELEGEKS